MSGKSDTLQSLKAELEAVNATIAKYQKVRAALIEVITFLGNEELQALTKIPAEATAEADEPVEATASEEEGDGAAGLPALPTDGIEAVRKALAARNRS